VIILKYVARERVFIANSTQREGASESKREHGKSILEEERYRGYMNFFFSLENGFQIK
jgi:hypothetical protein